MTNSVHVRAPLQDRSRRTLDSILDAAETLLRDRGFERISVSDIVDTAGCSTGSFYARFPSKDALLPALYARYDADLPDRVARIRAARDWSVLSLSETIDSIIAELIDSFATRPNLMRAMVNFVRARPDALPDEMLRTRRGHHRAIEEIFERFHPLMPHEDPAAAVRAGLFLVITAARERMLFPDAPFAAVTQVPLARFTRELSRMLFSYLTTEEG